MTSLRSSHEIGAREGAVGDAFQLVAQGLAQLQEALRLEKQEAERKVQEAEKRMQEALRLQEERAAAALREMERKLQEKDDAIRALQQRHQDTQERLTALEESTTAPGGSGGKGGVQVLKGRVDKVEASLQSAVQKFLPRVEALLRQLEEPRSARASLATAASTSAGSAHEAPATGGAAAGSGEEAPFPTPAPTSSGASHQGAAADEEGRARQRVELRVREVEMRMEEARTSPSSLGEQLCEAADEGRLNDVRRLIDSGADVNYTNLFGYIPLINAACKADANVVSLLLQRGADANAVNCYGSCALHFAAGRDRSVRCLELLLRAGADVDARNIDGETPLHYAAYNDNEAAVRALLAAGARRHLRARKGRWENKTPLDIASSPDVQRLLRL